MSEGGCIERGRPGSCLITGARLLDPATGMDRVGELRVEKGRITGVGDFLAVHIPVLVLASSAGVRVAVSR